MTIFDYTTLIDNYIIKFINETFFDNVKELAIEYRSTNKKHNK